MISDFSSFVEFFAAIYVTMAVNNDFCSNFWTPKYYEEMKSLLNVYKFNGSSSIHDKLLAQIKEKYNIVQNNAHHRGFILLVLCVFYLIFMGFENEKNSLDVAHYVPIMYCTLFVGIILTISNFVFKNWRYVILFVILCVATYITLKVLNSDAISQHPISLFLYEYKRHIMIGIIIFPIVYQIYVYWLYSSIYKGYLKEKVAVEYERFHTSMNGIENKEKSKVDKIYLDIWTDTKFNSGEDTTLTPFYEELNKQLLLVASPTHWQLVTSWLNHHRKNFVHKCQYNDINEANIVLDTIIPNQLKQYKTQETNKLDFQKEYDDYCIWKKTAGKNSSIRAYCAAKKLPVKDVLAWLRVNKPKKK